MDDREIPVAPDEIRLFTVIRNESLRLPFFLKYYFDMGVDRVFVVDNGSTDDSARLVLDHDRTHVIRTRETYAKHTFWIEALLDRYGMGHWCVVVDADEFMVFPRSEETSLRHLVQYLDGNRYTGVRALLLDLFSKEPFDEIVYESGTDPLEVCAFFDADYCRQPVEVLNRRTGFFWNHEAWAGGTRKRVFDVESCASKAPLFRYDKGVSPSVGTHHVGGVNHADVEAAVLHFKYLQSFRGQVQAEVEREQHWDNASEYRGYQAAFAERKISSLYWPGAVRYVDTRQLVDLGLLRDSEGFRSSCRLPS